jgi:hypothetical protein
MTGDTKSAWDHLARVIKFFGQSEVKTPLSLVFKVVPYLTLAYTAILYAPGISQEVKLKIIVCVSIVFFVLCLLVCLFAWFRPTHLVYGESGHRAERRMEYGTERESIYEADLAALRPMRDKTMLPERRKDQ